MHEKVKPPKKPMIFIMGLFCWSCCCLISPGLIPRSSAAGSFILFITLLLIREQVLEVDYGTLHCIFRMTKLNLIRTVAGNFYYYFTLIINILGIILGITMALWPAIAVFSAAFLVGAYLILLGIDSIVMAAGRWRHKW